MHIEPEPTEQVISDKPEYEEIVEEYKEEVLVQEKTDESPTDFANTAPAQGKPRCMTPNSYIHHIYICALRCKKFMEPTFIKYYPMSPTSDKFVLLLCYAYDPSVA
jgi:hypothetical protein